MKRNVSYLGLCFIAPGLGQFALKRWVRGTIMFLGSLGAFFGALWLVVRPMIVNIGNLLAGSERELAGINVPVILALSALMVALWIWSMIDIVVCKEEDPKKANEQEGASGEKANEQEGASGE